MSCERREGKAGLLAHMALAACCSLLFACGSADSTRAERPQETPEETLANPSITTCPSFSFYAVLPKDIAPGEVATVMAYATDMDSDDTDLTYDWIATSGEFSEPDLPLTKYECAATGDQVLRVTSTDVGGCKTSLDLNVVCMAP